MGWRTGVRDGEGNGRAGDVDEGASPTARRAVVGGASGACAAESTGTGPGGGGVVTLRVRPAATPLHASSVAARARTLIMDRA